MSGKTGTTASNRACDRCRKRKAKCDFVNSTCSRCNSARLKCTFDLPVQRRGPKTRYPITPTLITTSATTTTSAPLATKTATRETSVSDTTWEADVLKGLDVDISSSQPVVVLESPPLDQESSRLSSAFQLWSNLATHIGSSLPAFTLEELVRRCFDLYFEYLFPLIPLVDEQSLLESLESFLAGNLEVWTQSTFTLITALCAEVAFLLPADIFPEGCVVSDAFLKASRSCLNSYLDTDLENPNATSIIIRYYHYDCFHAAGRPNYAWHIFGEATRLAQVMRLNEEESYEPLYPLEAELRRRAFWMIFIGDKSAAILNNRPIILHKLSFETGITTAFPAGEVTDLAPTIPSIMNNSHHNFVAGFNANIKLWQVVSDILLEMRMLQEHTRITQSIKPSLSSQDSSNLDALYVRFITCLDDLPHYLRMDDFTENDIDYQQSNNKVGTIQKVNLQITFHFLRMVILQKLSTLEVHSQSKSNSRMLILRKTDVARDVLQVIRGAPFWALQVNGEPCVEKIRLIGASLLGILQEAGNETTPTSPLSTRARSDFSNLLDVLARLDFRASETLRYDK